MNHDVRLLRSLEFCFGLCVAWQVCAQGSGSVPFSEQVDPVPVTAGGQSTALQTHFCRPSQAAPVPLVIINHGSPPNSEDRPRMQWPPCTSEAIQWFLARGYAVAYPLRRGYGATGGLWAEDYGSCTRPDYIHAGVETARDIDAVVRYAASLPFVRPEGIVVVGQSAGGWGAIAYDALAHPGVSAVIVMAGGRGGHRHNQPNSNCAPDQLVEAAARFGRTARTPMLWVYAANDSFFAPALARAMWHAFTTAGGTAELQQPGPFDGDGHRLFFGDGGSAVWGPLIEAYLQSTAKAEASH